MASGYAVVLSYSVHIKNQVVCAGAERGSWSPAEVCCNLITRKPAQVQIADNLGLDNYVNT